MQLNSKQEKAKNKINGPLLIIAGAGSGKTATLTARVEYMIREKQILPSNILMVTFTNKAAKEMRERVCFNLGIETVSNIYKNRSSVPLIGTFHSLGLLFLKEMLSQYSFEELDIGIKKDFVIYDESDKLSVIKGIMKDFLLEEKENPSRQISSYISNAKNALITAKAYENEIDSHIKEIVFKVYSEYEKRLKQNNAMDFDDILIKTLSLFKIPQILEYYQEKYKYIMVDEYQDTNITQYKIVRLLAGKYKNIAVVGDDSQSIYSWRGADMRNILNFKKDYPDALIIKLEQNYRSTKTILTGANAVIEKNAIGLKKNLWTDNVSGEQITYIEAPDDKLEAKIIASIIEETSLPTPLLKEERGVEHSKYSDNLILYRTNVQSRKIEEALMMKNIPYRVVGGLKFYDRKEIKDLLAYLRVIFNSSDVVSMKRIINVPSRKIGAKSIEILDTYRDNFGLSYLQVIENVDEIEELKPMAKNSIKNFSEIYKKLIELSSKLVVSELIEELIKSINYKEYLFEGLSSDEKQAKEDNMGELINVASEYNGMNPRESLSQFLEEVALITDMDTKDERSDYVTLMTIHTSKGLEQKRVFLTGLEDGIFPSFRSLNDTANLEEERRLLYVAMTRAREELFISRAMERFHFGDYVRNLESRFMKEIPRNLIDDYDLSKLDLGGGSVFNTSISSINIGDNIESTFSLPKSKKQVNNDITKFAMGDRISHPKFGNGIITELKGELAEIAFLGQSIKKMNIKIAPVRKI